MYKDQKKLKGKDLNKATAMDVLGISEKEYDKHINEGDIENISNHEIEEIQVESLASESSKENHIDFKYYLMSFNKENQNRMVQLTEDIEKKIEAIIAKHENIKKISIWDYLLSVLLIINLALGLTMLYNNS